MFGEKCVTVPSSYLVFYQTQFRLRPRPQFVMQRLDSVFNDGGYGFVKTQLTFGAFYSK